MDLILGIRDSIKRFYAKFDVIVDPVVKLVLVLASLIVINSGLGRMEALKDPFVIIIICLACVLLPYGLIDCLLAAVITAHFYVFDSILALAVFAIFFVVGVLYCCFRPGHSWLLMVIPLFFALKIPYIIPIIVGITCSVSAIVPVAFGTVIYFIIANTAAYTEALETAGKGQIVDMILGLMEALVRDRTMFVMTVAFIAATASACFIRKLSVDYSHVIAAVVSALVMMIITASGKLGFGADISLPAAVLHIFISAVLTAGLSFVILPLDYSRTERTGFEDDDYYYYVKAVPKMKHGYGNTHTGQSGRKGDQ